MRTEFSSYKIILWSICLALSLNASAKDSDGDPLEQARVRILSYNINHILQTPELDRDTGKLTYRTIPEKLVALKAKAILDQDPDVAVLIETEGKEQLESFNQSHLGGRYYIWRIPGNSARGSEIAMLVKKNRFFYGRYVSQRHVMFRDPVDHQIKPIWSRDTPILYLQKSKNAHPDLVVAGVHLKSMKKDSARLADRFNETLVKLQEVALIELYEKIRSEVGEDVPIIFAGDFNRAVDNPKMFPLLKKVMREATQAHFNPLTNDERLTHTRFYNDGSMNILKESQIDAFFMSENAVGKILDTRAIPQPNCEGLMVQPSTYEQRNSMFGSDHKPIRLDLYLPNVAVPK